MARSLWRRLHGSTGPARRRFRIAAARLEIGDLRGAPLSQVADLQIALARAWSPQADFVTASVRQWQRRGSAKAVVEMLSNPPILVFSLSIGEELMTISMSDWFRLAAARGRRRGVGMAIGLLERSRLA
jgi:hypothetical protein